MGQFLWFWRLWGVVCKSRAYDAVQAAAGRVPDLKRGAVFDGVGTPAMGKWHDQRQMQGAMVARGSDGG